MKHKQQRFTQADFDAFVTEAKRVIVELSLSDWRVDFNFTELGDNEAQCNWNVSQKSSVLALTTKSFDACSDSPRVRALRCARHEVLELLLAPIGTALSNYAAELICERMTHDIVRRLENLV